MTDKKKRSGASGGRDHGPQQMTRRRSHVWRPGRQGYFVPMSMIVDYDPQDQFLNLVSDEVHLVIQVPVSDLANLSDIDRADWSTRSSLRVGTALGHPVFWTRGTADQVTILVGGDDETWGLALTISTAVVGDILALATEADR